jgi:hypothetical protein
MSPLGIVVATTVGTLSVGASVDAVSLMTVEQDDNTAVTATANDVARSMLRERDMALRPNIDLCLLTVTTVQ